MVSAVGACAEATGPGVLPALTVDAALDSVRLSSVGESQTLAASTRRGSRLIAAAILWFSAADSIATVSPAGRVTARGHGVTRIYVVSDSGGVDSLFVRVQPVFARLRFTATRASLMSQRQFRFAVVAADSSGVPLAVSTAPVTWSVSPEARATVASGGLVTAGATGPVIVRATVGTIVAETTLVVTGLPALRFARDTLRLGRFLLRRPGYEEPLLVADSSTASDRATITIGPTDSTIARVTRRIVMPFQTVSDSNLQFAGVNVGTARVRASAPGWTDAEAVLVVDAPRLRIMGARSPVILRTGALRVEVEALDGEGRVRPFVATPWIRIRSLDTKVVAVEVDSFPLALTNVRARAEGTTQVIVEQVGFIPDTVTVTVKQRDLLFRSYPELEALAMRGSIGHRRRVGVGSSQFVTDSLLVTLTQRSPGTVRLSALTGTIRNGGFEPQFSFDGLAEGVDTIVASTPGMRSDTLIVVIGRPVFAPSWDTPWRVSLLDARSASVSITDSLVPVGYVSRFGDPYVFRVVSSDTTVVRARSDGIIQPTMTGGSVPLEFTGVGTAMLRAEDPLGLYIPLDLGPITVETARLLLGEEYGPRGGFEMGIGTAVAVDARADLNWMVTLPGVIRSSDTTVLRVKPGATPQRLPGPAMVSSTGNAGSAWIIASGSGLVGDSILVRVTTKPRLAAAPAGPVTANATHPFWASVYLVDGSGRYRSSADSITFRVRSSDAMRVQPMDSLIVLSANDVFSDPIRLRALQPGWAAIVVEDTRPAGVRLDPITIGVEVQAVAPGPGSGVRAPD